MIGHRSLVEASFAFNGSFNNGRGRTRVGAHEIVVTAADQKAARLAATGILQKIVDDNESFGHGAVYWQTPVFQSLKDSVEASGLSEHTLAELASSELDPEWVLNAQPEEVLVVASLLKTCREIAGQVHSAEMVVHSD